MMKQLSTFGAIALGLCCGVQSALASPFDCANPLPAETSQKLMAGVESRSAEVQTLQAGFIQQSIFLGLDRKEYSKGKVAFRKPGMMSWAYEEPEKQRFVADGKTVSFYQPGLNQVTVGDFKNSFDSELPVTFLLGLGTLSGSFTLQSACTSSEGTVLELSPKSADANLSAFALLLKGKELSPVGAKITDIGGNETTILFEGPRFNEAIPDSEFRLDIPKGVDVIDQRSLPQALSRGDVKESDATPKKK